MIEDCRLKIEYLWNAVDLKKTEHSLRLVGVLAPTPRRAIH